MTYEYAAYFKLLILCGYKEELQQYIDHALTEQDPLSDIILALSSPGLDDKQILSVLNEYLRQADSDIDWDKTVFELVMSFLKRAYDQDDMTMPKITGLMYRLAEHTNRTDIEPWNTMYFMGDLFDEAEIGLIDKAEYQRNFENFIYEHICLSEYSPALPKESLLKKVLRWIQKSR